MEKSALVFASEASTRLLTLALTIPYLIVTSFTELAAKISSGRPTVVYVDIALLPQLAQLDVETSNIVVVAISDGAHDVLINALNASPRLSHVVTTAMLSSPLARSHLASLHARLDGGFEQSFLGTDGIVRAALMTCSARRELRLERMREFFAAHDASGRTIAMLSEIAEELVTNALYDAPAEAGYFTGPVPRTEEIELPTDHACEISYGVDGGRAFVRIRDPFGALTRSRMLGVLNRCNTKEVSLDESRGGAGLGLWRVFSTGSMIAISVIPGRLTDIVVWVDMKKARKQLLGVHLFFPDRHALDGVQSRFAAEHDFDLIDDSFTALIT